MPLFFAVFAYHGSPLSFGQTNSGYFRRHCCKVRDRPTASLVHFCEVCEAVRPRLVTPEYFALFRKEKSIDQPQLGQHSPDPVSDGVFRVFYSVGQLKSHLLDRLVTLVLFEKIENLQVFRHCKELSL